MKKRARKKVTPKSYLPVAKITREELVLDNKHKQSKEGNGCTQNLKTESQTRPFSPYDAQLTASSVPLSPNFFQACSALDSWKNGAKQTKLPTSPKQQPPLKLAAVSANDIFSPSYFSNVHDACKHYAAKWTPTTISSPTPVLPLESVASCQSGPHVTNTPQFKKDSVQSIIGVGKKLLFFSSEKEESYTPLPYKVAFS